MSGGRDEYLKTRGFCRRRFDWSEKNMGGGVKSGRRKEAAE